MPRLSPNKYYSLDPLSSRRFYGLFICKIKLSPKGWFRVNILIQHGHWPGQKKSYRGSQKLCYSNPTKKPLNSFWQFIPDVPTWLNIQWTKSDLKSVVLSYILNHKQTNEGVVCVLGHRVGHESTDKSILCANDCQLKRRGSVWISKGWSGWSVPAFPRAVLISSL